MGYLETLVDVAARREMLSPEIVASATAIRKAGNRVGHEEATTDGETKNLLAQAAQVLRHLYKS